MDDPAAISADDERGRVGLALRRRANWEQLVKFCAVGAVGYGVNLAVYAVLQVGLNVHYAPAAVGSFAVAVTNNYLWNRLWTFRSDRGRIVVQGARFFVVSSLALVANLVLLYALVEAGFGALPAQAAAILLVTPVNFIGNKLWSFRRR